MDLFFKAISFIIVAVIAALLLGKWEKETSLLLSIAACCIASVSVFYYLDPVLSFLTELEETAGFPSGMLAILLKAVGITFISEIAGSICSEAGCGSMTKVLQLLSTAAILYLSIPAFQSVLNILKDIIGEL